MKLTYKGEVMKTLLAVLVVVGMLVAIAMPATAEVDAKIVTEITERLKEGKSVGYLFEYPKGKRQMVWLKVDYLFSYIVDLRAKLCFLTMHTVGARPKNLAFNLVTCEAIKNGYPEIAPLITWVK